MSAFGESAEAGPRDSGLDFADLKQFTCLTRTQTHLGYEPFTASDYLCIWVGTPADGHRSADLIYVLQVAQSIDELMNENKVVIKKPPSLQEQQVGWRPRIKCL